MQKKSQKRRFPIYCAIAVFCLVSISGRHVLADGYDPKDRNFSATADYSSDVEKRIRSGETSTADLIVDYRPRLWLRNSFPDRSS